LLPPESSVEVIYLGSVMLTRLANPEADGALNDEIRQAGSTVKKKKEKKKKKKKRRKRGGGGGEAEERKKEEKEKKQTKIKLTNK